MKRLIAIAFAILGFTNGFAFSVNPMVSHFDPNTPRSQQIFVLSNPSSSEKPVEISVAKPLLDENGIESLDMGNGEDNFLIVPQQLVLPPNSKRSVKIFYVGDPMEEEDTYRFIFRELPVELAKENLPAGESSFSMRVVMQYNTRVWLTPKGLSGELAITDFDRIEMDAPAKVDRDPENETPAENVSRVPMLRFTVANTGGAHSYLRYPKISLVQKNGNRFELSEESLQFVAGQVVMKQSQKDFKIRWQDDFPDLAEIERIDLATTRR